MSGAISPLTASVIERLELAGKLNAVQRLREVASRQSQIPYGDDVVNTQPNDAAKLDLSPAFSKASRIHIAGKLEGVAKPKEVNRPQGVFYPGAEFHGEYKAGHFSTSSGPRGTYEVIEGRHIKFKVGGFTGYLLGQGNGVAYNPSSGEAYRFKVEAGRGTYKVSEVEPFSSEKFVPEPGQEPLVDQATSQNVKFRIGANGLFGVKVLGDSEDDVIYSGEGFLDSNGNYFLTLSNGNQVTGHYSWGEDGNLQIYDRRSV